MEDKLSFLEYRLSLLEDKLEDKPEENKKEEEIPNRTDVLKPNYESKLGTLDHWNEAYKQEIEQFKNNDNLKIHDQKPTSVSFRV